MLNKFFKFLLTIWVALNLSPIIVTAEANTPTFAGKYSQGVGNITIYIDSSTKADYWETYITTGANNWMYPGSGMSNPIYIKFVSSTYGSKMDFYCAKDSHWSKSTSKSTGILAETEFYDSNENQLNPSKSSTNWYYAKIYINDDEFRKSTFSNENVQGTIIHEMGHAFGLAHNNENPRSIMCQTKYYRLVQRVQAVDNNSIISKYN